MVAGSIGGYGHNQYALVAGQRVLVGLTRTVRPSAGESSIAFHQRVDVLTQMLAPLGGMLTIEEELRDGVLVQVCVRWMMSTLPTISAPPSVRRRRTRESA